MAVKAPDFSGYWAGMLVHFPSTVRIHATITVEGKRIKGTFELPDITDDLARGSFTGSQRGRSVKIQLRRGDQHGRLRFEGQMVDSSGQSMLHGVVSLPGAEIPFATLTLIKKDSPFVELHGFWPFQEFRGAENRT